MMWLLLAFLHLGQVAKVDGTALSRFGAPSMGTCGTSPSVSGTDAFGTITVGTGTVTSCAMNFSTTFSAAPACVIAISSAIITPGVATSTTAMTVTLSLSLGGGKIFYLCMGT